MFDGTPKSTGKIPDLSVNIGSAPPAAPGDTLPDTGKASESRKSDAIRARLLKKSGFGAKPRAHQKTVGSDLPGGVDRATARRVANAVKFNCFGKAFS